VTLKSGQQNASSVDSRSPMHPFEIRTSSTLPRCSRVTSNPEVEPQSQTVRIRLRGLEASSGSSELDAHRSASICISRSRPLQNTVLCGEGGAGAFSRSELAPAQWGVCRVEAQTNGKGRLCPYCKTGIFVGKSREPNSLQTVVWRRLCKLCYKK
jgi:hypothetical protein